MKSRSCSTGVSPVHSLPHGRHARVTGIEFLESRRLLSFAAFGAEGAVPTLGTSVSADSAVADNGSFIVASAVNHKESYSLQATRYSAQGELVGKTLVLFAQKNVKIADVAVATDADGDSVVA